MTDATTLFGAGPVLPVPDVRAAADYYQSVLGFELDFVQDPPEHGSVTRGRVGIQFTRVPTGAAAAKYAGWTYIFVTGLDALCDEFRQNGARIAREPESHPHGMREFEIEDLNGHRLRFGEYL